MSRSSILLWIPGQKMLSGDVIDYISRAFLNKHRHLGEKFVINIISDTPLDEERAEKMIRDGFRQEKDDTGYSVKQLTLKEIYLAIIGIAILAVWVYLSATREGVNMEILSIMGWVAVWEAFSIAIIQRPELRIEQKNLDRLVNAEIRFQISENEETGTAD